MTKLNMPIESEDIHKYLIAVLSELTKGWTPPDTISEELYNTIKNDKKQYPDYLVGYVGFQLSYGGKWFGGYRRDKIGNVIILKKHIITL